MADGTSEGEYGGDGRPSALTAPSATKSRTQVGQPTRLRRVLLEFPLEFRHECTHGEVAEWLKAAVC
jgi:hypothetical protein